MYEGDAPLAERRAAALVARLRRCWPSCSGQAELRELLDADALAEVERELQRLPEDRRAARRRGRRRPAAGARPADRRPRRVERGATPPWLAELEGARRAIRVRIAGEERWAARRGRRPAARRARRRRCRSGVPEAFLEPVADPLGDLVARYARTHGPFTARRRRGAARARRRRSSTRRSHRLAGSGRVVEGEFRPGGAGTEWCDAEVLRLLRRRSLAALRQEVEPVPPEALARFLPAWQDVGGGGCAGVDGVLRVVEQLQGAPVPASALETLVLPARVAGYSPALLDELTAAGEVLWAGPGSLPGDDGWVSLHLADAAPLSLPLPDDRWPTTPLHAAVLDALDGGGALFFRDAVRPGRRRTATTPALVARAVGPGLGRARSPTTRWRRCGRCSAAGRGAHRARRHRRRTAGTAGRAVAPMPSRTGPPTVAGRWSLLPARETDPTRRAHALAEALLDRHGVRDPRRGRWPSASPGGFAAVYPVLAAFEEAGRCRRGYFVEGLGAAQFALPGAVDRLRAVSGRRWSGREPATAGRARRCVLAATDPANPYGAALPWPDRPGEAAPATGRAARPARWSCSSTARSSLYVERGGRTLLSWTDDAGHAPARRRRAGPRRPRRAARRLAVERADGSAVLDSPLGRALEAAGFHPTPRGLRLRG